jgi:peptide deformylase
MASREILRMGDARLLRRAEEVRAFDSRELHALLADMRDTMQALDGAGLAAPQIGENLRVVMFGGQPSPRYPDAENVPETVLINPVITPLAKSGRPLSDVHKGSLASPEFESGADMVEGWEGCLSVPGMRGLVPRFACIRYRGQDQHGALIDRIVSGFHARVVQHECDHLDGILYPMRIRDMKKFGYTDVLFPGRELRDE